MLKRSQDGSREIAQTPELKHKDFTNLVPVTDPEALPGAPLRKPFIAYKAGQTDLGHDETLKIASNLMEKISVYDFYKANCQHFVVDLLDEILTRLGDRSVFFGTAKQIAAWDLKCSGHFSEYNNIEAGVCVLHQGQVRELSIRDKGANLTWRPRQVQPSFCREHIKHYWDLNTMSQ